MKSFEYYFNLINTYYGKDVAKRSQVPLIAHIIEGVNVLKSINATDEAIRAFMIHPIFQDDSVIETNLKKYAHAIDSKILGLVIEYRKVANAYLTKRTIKDISEIELSILKDVNDMLIADKVQNYKDFLQYHSKTHDRKIELDLYFNNWFKRLNVNFDELVKFCYDVAVTVKIINNKDEILLLNRYSTDRTYIGQCHPGGKLEIGESLIEGLLRETKEEIDAKLDLQKLRYFDAFLCETKKGLKSVFTYEYRVNSNPLEFELNKDEFESCECVNKEQWNEFWNSVVIDYENGMFYAIDYDNTIAPDKFPEIGEPTVDALEGLRKILSNQNNHIIIWTMRNSDQQTEILKKLRKDYNLRILGCNEHLIQHQWTDSSKIYADYFIDDRNIGTPLIEKMVDWKKLNL